MVREALHFHIRRQTDIPLAEQTLGPRTRHRTDIGLGIEETGLDSLRLYRLLGSVFVVMSRPAPRLWVLTAATQRRIESDNLTIVFGLLLMRLRL
jgi:hypothetical protein